MNKNKNPLNLIKLIFVNLIGLSSSRPKTENYFPKSFGRFRFEKILRNELRGSTLGIYEYKTQKVIVKTYQGRSKGMDYLTLQNEIELSKLLNKVLKRVEKNLPLELQNIKIPKILSIKKSKNSVFIISEFIDSVSLKTMKTRDQTKLYFRVIKFLRFLGDNMTEKEKAQVSRRDAATIIKLYPFMVIKSVLTHPSAATKLLKGISVFIKLSKLIHKLPIVLSHKDLHLGNILISKKNIYIIDLEFTIFAPEIFDEFTTLRHEWGNSSLKNALLTQVQKHYRNYDDLSSLLRVVALNVATHSLTANNFPKSLKENYFNLLKYSLNKNAFKKSKKEFRNTYET